MKLPLLPLVLCEVPPGLIQALEQDGVPFVCADMPAQRQAGRFVLFDRRRSPAPKIVAGQQAIDIATCDIASHTIQPGTGKPRSLTSQLVDASCCRKRWQFGNLQPSERVATFDKRAARHQLLAGVRQKVEAAGGIWITLASCPAEYQAAFCLRVDYDEVARDDVESFLSAIAGCERATSHYLCASAYGHQSDVHERLQGLHVGGHGYWHHTYATRAENLHNIRRGLESLAQAGLNPDGFVAPHGRFNAELLGSLEQLEVSHSSEFALAYDDRPFFPRHAGGNASSVLQIPVHPISLGVLLEAANAQNERQAAELVSTHYLAWLEANTHAGECTFVYGHPERRLGRYPEIVRELLGAAFSNPNLWKTNLREFGQWWRARSHVQVQVDEAAGGINVRSSSPVSGWTPAIEVWRGDSVASLPIDHAETFVKLPNGMATTAEPNSRDNHLPQRGCGTVTLKFRQRPLPPELEGTLAPQAFSFRAALRNYVDWERATPASELRVRSLRQLLKKALRHTLAEPASRSLTIATSDD